MNSTKALVAGIFLLGIAAAAAASSAEPFGELGDDEPAPARRPVQTYGKRRFAAKKLYGTHVLASQSALSMKKLASRGGPLAARAGELADRMRANAAEALALAREVDPSWVAQKEG